MKLRTWLPMRDLTCDDCDATPMFFCRWSRYEEPSYLCAFHLAFWAKEEERVFRWSERRDTDGYRGMQSALDLLGVMDEYEI